MRNIILNNWGLKLLALFLAMVTWYYIVVELQKGAVEEREALQSILPYRVYSKELPIKLNLIGEPPNGYMIDYDNLLLEPSKFVIVGPKSILKKLISVKTRPIDISEHTKTFKKAVSIVMPAKGITIKDKFINVTIPITKAKD